MTPDSFSDGGQFSDTKIAVQQALRLVAQGADIIDIGGESTRPGAQRIPPELEQSRVLPVIEAVRAETSVPLSIDTLNSSTATIAAELGVNYVNDVSGGLSDREMFRSVAKTEASLILGHSRGPSAQMDSMARYENVAKEVAAELAEQVALARAAGIENSRLIVDPGLGFAKNVEQNWQLVARLDELQKLGLPILVGASRKRFIASALDSDNPSEVAHGRRDLATAVLTALLLQRGLWGVRVHNVEATKDAIGLVRALKNAEDDIDS